MLSANLFIHSNRFRQAATWFALSGSLLATGCFMPGHPPASGDIVEFTLHSNHVGEDYEIFVRLPPDYHRAGGDYPVVLQLDAQLGILDEFAITAGFASDLEAQGKIPDTIVVGIGHTGDKQAGRFRDFTIPGQRTDGGLGLNPGGADDFLDFLTEELMPELEARYRLRGPEGRALFGHSLGGLFATYALMQERPTSPEFAAFVAISPGYLDDSGAIFDRLPGHLHSTSPPRLCLAMGAQEGPELVVYYEAFIDKLGRLGLGDMIREHHFYPGGHTDTLSPGFRDGLRCVHAIGLGGGQ